MKAVDSSSLSKYLNKEENYKLVANEISSAGGCSSLEMAMSEVGNSVWKRVLKREITSDAALAVYQEFTKAVTKDGLISLEPMDEELLNSSLKVAIEEGITFYDSSFIELGHKEGRGLITSDEKQRKIFKKRYPKLDIVYID